MSSHRQESRCRPRTSQRMRLKMLRNLDEYKIHNPYRNKAHPLPDELSRQLHQIDFLSSASIRMLSMPPSPTPSLPHEHNLTKMAQAHQEQEDRFHSIFGHSGHDQAEIEHEHYSHSEAPPTHPSNGPQPTLREDQLHLRMYEDRSHLDENLFELRVLGGQELQPMEQEQPWQPLEAAQPPVALQQIEQYFIS